MADFEIKSVKPPSHFKKEKFWAKAVRFQFIYSMTALLFGLACVVAGVALFVNGVSGASSWTTKFLGLESTISDAAPGAILFVVGFLIVFATRFDVTTDENGKKDGEGAGGS